MAHVDRLITILEGEIIMFPSRRLSDDEFTLHIVEGHLAIDMGHVPVDPSTTHFVVEAVDDSVPCSSTNAIATLQEQS